MIIIRYYRYVINNRKLIFTEYLQNKLVRTILRNTRNYKPLNHRKKFKISILFR